MTDELKPLTEEELGRLEREGGIFGLPVGRPAVSPPLLSRLDLPSADTEPSVDQARGRDWTPASHDQDLRDPLRVRMAGAWRREAATKHFIDR